MEVRGPSSTLTTAALFIAGVLVFGYGVYSYQAQSTALENSVEINATVTAKNIDADPGRRGTDYIPQVEYSYSFEDNEYTSDSVYPGPSSPSFGTERAARQEIQNYTVGENTTAYLNSENPSEAFLKNESTNTPFIIMIIGAALASFSIYSLLKN